jgi:ATP phosphoribosyltransferase regulatory subunit
MKSLTQGQSGIEKAVNLLCALYSDYGFTQYKMSKFEEYDLYVKNKDFLVSKNVITFTDTDGKLMALKPDVTLSIIKNGSYGNGVEKLYYNETVYRVSKGTKSFKEFMQVGLECLGEIDDYQITEVLFLAAKSLESLSEDFVLDVSHLGVVKGVLDKLDISQQAKSEIVAYLGEKNLQSVKAVCEREGVLQEQLNAVCALVEVYGNPDLVIEKLKALKLTGEAAAALIELENIICALKAFGVNAKINVDFSVIDDMNYYNGIVFKGFISGIPTAILSGGQYDKLMQKMGKKSRAIGFAVYLDELEKLFKADEFVLDVAIEYGNKSASEVSKKVKEIKDQGQSVIAVKKLSSNMHYKKLITL